MPEQRVEHSYWLVKSEPTTFSFDDLLASPGRTTRWDGIRNPSARNNLKAMRKGDRVFFYHSGDDRAVIGEMKVTADPTPDPADPAGKQVVVKVKPVRKFKYSVPLVAIKSDKSFANWELVRISRLSVMPVPEEIWKKIEAMSEEA